MGEAGLAAKHLARVDDDRAITQSFGQRCQRDSNVHTTNHDQSERWQFNIDEYFDMPMATYSSGMNSRFNFALMLALEFDMYLIDEGMPSSTDVEFNKKAGDLLQERIDRTTIVIVSHQPETLEQFATQAAVLRDGQFIQFDTLEEAKQVYDFETQS